MLTVTQKAKELLKQILDDTKQKPDVSLRINHDPEKGFQLSYDKVREGDQAFQHDEKNVLLVDKSTCERVKDIVMDVKDTPEGTQFVLK
jgi:Fe-S cluster assembly iron-binding protein IscA